MSPASWIFLPTPTLLGIIEHQPKLPASESNFPLAICFTYGNVYVSMLLSQLVPLSFPYCVHKFVLYVWFPIAALQIGSSVPSS